MLEHKCQPESNVSTKVWSQLSDIPEDDKDQMVMMINAGNSRSNVRRAMLMKKSATCNWITNTCLDNLVRSANSVRRHSPHLDAFRLISRLEQLHQKSLVSRDVNASLGPAFFYSWERDENLQLKRVFFSTPFMQECFRVSGHFVVIDSTFKTSRYDLQLLQFVGVMSDFTTAAYAHALVPSENADNVTWAFEQFRKCFPSSMSNLEVVMTDGHLAYPKSIEKVFPGVDHQRCSYHISVDMDRSLRLVMKTKRYEIFYSQWKIAVYETDVAEHEKKWKELISSYPDAEHVLRGQENYKQKFCHAWVSKQCNFGSYSSQRVESKHFVSNFASFRRMLSTVDSYSHFATFRRMSSTMSTNSL
jgi:hypothetical protein